MSSLLDIVYKLFSWYNIYHMSSEIYTPLSAQEVEGRFNAIVTVWNLDERYHPAARLAMDHYVQNGLYHNLNHMFEVTERVLALFDEYQEHEDFDLTMQDRQELLMAALWHDADYHLPIGNSVEESKEYRSATLAFNAITSTSEPKGSWENTAFAGGVAYLILSTQADKQVEYGTAAYLLNTADLDNLTGTTQETLLKSGKFFIEQLMADGKQATASAQEALDAHSDTLRSWCLKARARLNLLAEAKQLPEDINKRITQITPGAIKGVLAKLALQETAQNEQKEA